MRNDDIDVLLRRALSSKETPDKALIRKIKFEVSKEEPDLRKFNARHSFRTVAGIALALVLFTTTAFAAWYLWKPSEVADHLGDDALSVAFESEDAININESAASGDYIFTLLAVVSGKDITDFLHYSNGELHDERTYAVVAIRKADGTPMPDSMDEEYGNPPFFATPLVKGLDPSRLNAITMNGGYSSTVKDGVMYRIVDCDDVAIFADHGLYFAVSTSTFYDRDAFLYNEQTGGLKANPDYDGASVVFDLPIDKSLADPEKAEKYLRDNGIYQQLYQPQEDNDAKSDRRRDENAPDPWKDVDWEKAKPVASTVKELTVSEDGKISYSYEFEHGSGTLNVLFDTYFKDKLAPQSVIVSKAASDNALYGVRFTLDENGTMKGMVVVPDPSNQ